AMLMRAVDRHNMLPGSASSAGFASSGASSMDGNRPSAWAVFGGARKVVESQELEAAEAMAVFGGVQLDLRHAATKRDEVVIEANAFFGGVDMTVPENWDVLMRGSAVFGGYEDRTTPPASSTDVKRPRLVVTGLAVFGGVTVK